MKMTCVNRLNYNYYYFSFDVVRQSNYKIVKKEEGEREGERGREREKERVRLKERVDSFLEERYKIKLML